MENICNKYNVKLPLEEDKAKNTLTKTLKLFDKIYSIFVNKIYYEGVLAGYNVTITQYEENKYNTIKINDTLVNNIFKAINNCTNTYQVYFEQPSLDIMYEVYYNYTCKLSADITKRYPNLNYDDIVQMCAMAMLNLYNKGYYINKKLIQRTVYNYLYLEHRKDKRNVSTISIDENYDMLNNVKDEQYDNKSDDKRNSDAIHSIYINIYPIIIEAIGERRLKNLLQNQNDRCCSRQNKNDIKNIIRILKKHGYDRDWYINQIKGGN